MKSANKAVNAGAYFVRALRTYVCSNRKQIYNGRSQEGHGKAARFGISRRSEVGAARKITVGK